MDNLKDDAAITAAAGQLRKLAAATAIGPSTIGFALIAVVLLDDGSTMITRSAAVAATALVVGALLILGSATLYCLRPGNFVDFAEAFGGHTDQPAERQARETPDRQR